MRASMPASNHLAAGGSAGSGRRRGYTAGWVAVAVALGSVLAAANLGFGPDEYKTQQPAQRCLGN